MKGDLSEEFHKYDDSNILAAFHKDDRYHI